jgi:hypothetical protein
MSRNCITSESSHQESTKAVAAPARDPSNQIPIQCLRYRRRSTKIMSKYVHVLLLACATYMAAPAHAATVYNQVFDGAVCTPYPLLNNGLSPYQHYLYSEGGTVFCHLTMSSDWPAADLSYAVVFGTLPVGKTATARLCVHDLIFAVTCGDLVQLRGQGGANNAFSNFANAPSPIPVDAVGAYVELTLPQGSISTVTAIWPVWVKP